MTRLERGYTSISGAMRAGMAYLGALTLHADRRIIDISTDGTNNDGVRPDIMRDLASQRGIIIDGLAITREVGYLDLYFQHHVITGPGSFVIKADDQLSYHEAIRLKLLREVSAPVS
jgi:Ca-activated chloride channel homolog